MSDSAEAADRRRVLDERDKAVQYYEDNGTRGNIQNLLNIMYFENPVDVNGFVAGFFHEISNHRLIYAISLDVSSLDSELRPRPVIHIRHLRFNHPRVVASLPCWLTTTETALGESLAWGKFDDKLKGLCVWDYEDIDSALAAVVADLVQAQSHPSTVVRSSFVNEAATPRSKNHGGFSPLPVVNEEVEEALRHFVTVDATSRAPLEARVSASLHEGDVQRLMELRAGVSQAVALAGAACSQLELYRFVWCCMDSWKARRYPVASWTGDDPAAGDHGIPASESSEPSSEPQALVEDRDSVRPEGEEPRQRPPKKHATPSSEKIQKYVDATIPAPEAAPKTSLAKKSGNVVAGIPTPTTSAPSPLVLQEGPLPTASLDHDHKTGRWPRIRDCLPRPVVPVFSFRSPPPSSSSSSSSSPSSGTNPHYGTVAHVDTVYVVPAAKTEPEVYGRLIRATTQAIYALLHPKLDEAGKQATEKTTSAAPKKAKNRRKGRSRNNENDEDKSEEEEEEEESEDESDFETLDGNENARRGAKAKKAKKSVAARKGKAAAALPPVVYTDEGTLAFPQADSLEPILDHLTSVESVTGYRLGLDYELMIKFSPDAFLPEKMLVQTIRDTSSVTMAEYVEMLKRTVSSYHVIGAIDPCPIDQKYLWMDICSALSRLKCAVFHWNHGKSAALAAPPSEQGDIAQPPPPLPPPWHQIPGALDVPPSRWSEASFLLDEQFDFDDSLRPTGIILGLADKASFSELLALAVMMRCNGRFRGVPTALTSDMAEDRKWSHASAVDFAVGLAFDFVFFVDATAMEMRTKMERFLAIAKSLRSDEVDPVLVPGRVFPSGVIPVSAPNPPQEYLDLREKGFHPPKTGKKPTSPKKGRSRSPAKSGKGSGKSKKK